MKIKKNLKKNYFNFIKLNNLAKKLISLVLSSVISLMYQCNSLVIGENFFSNATSIDTDFHCKVGYYDECLKSKCLFMLKSVYSTTYNYYINIVYILSEHSKGFLVIYSKKKGDKEFIFSLAEIYQFNIKRFTSKDKDPRICMDFNKSIFELFSIEPTFKVKYLYQLARNCNSKKNILMSVGILFNKVLTAVSAAITTVLILSSEYFNAVFRALGVIGTIVVSVVNLALNEFWFDKFLKDNEVVQEVAQKEKIKLIKKRFVENSEKLFIQCMNAIEDIKLLESEPYVINVIKNDNYYEAVFFNYDLEKLGVYLIFNSKGKSNSRLVKLFECNETPIEYLKQFPIYNVNNVEKISILIYISTKIFKTLRLSGLYKKKILSN